MSGTGGTPGPGYDAQQRDTTQVSGNAGAAPSGTQNRASVVDTANTGGGSRTTEPGSPAAGALPDTSGTNSTNVTFNPVSTAMSGTPSTLNPGGGAGVAEANPAYRAPSNPVAASNRDTTRTSEQPGGSSTNPVPSSQNISNTETANIGAAGSGTGVAPVAPASAPTVATGPRYITVTWVAVADPATDPVREYVIESDRGGRWFAGRNVLTKRIDYTDPSQVYKFRVAARNRGGIGPFSALSAAIRAFNPDQADVLKPAGYSPDAVTAGVVNPDGTFKAGTGGTNNAPVLGAITPGAAASKTVTVNWTAPTVGDVPTSYVIKASNGTSTTSAAGTTSKAVVFAAAGASVTFTVQAINAKGSGVTSAASGAVTVP